MRILLLDDDDDLRSIMCDIFQVVGQGHDCVAVGSYRELLEHADRALNTDLAIIDINLGADVPSGLDCERWLRQRGYTGRVIFLTGHALNHPLVVQAVNAGNVEILEKPQGIQQLIDIVTSGKAA